MADRTIVARLRMEAQQFLATADRAAKATKSIGAGAEQASKQADSAFSRMAATARKNSTHIDRLGNTALIAGGTIAAGLGIAVKSFADFDQAMSAASAALPEAGARMSELRDLAVKLGSDTQFSATEAAQGVTELAKAGVNVEAIMGGGLKGALDLAASGQLAVADAAEIAASAMVQFKLKGKDVPHIADLLAAGAGKAQGSVYDLGQALNQAGLVAASTGVSIEETAGGLAAFASAGLTGSDAGTSFKTMLQRLTPQSEEARAEMERLGISAYDSQGQFIGLANFAGVLQTAMKDLTPEARNAAMQIIFGQDAVRAANVLFEQGATGIAKWTGEVNDAGFAANQAAKLTDNLKGDVERLGGALDAVFVQNGAAANDALRTMAQTLESAVEGFGSLPAPVQQGVLTVAALTAGSLLLAGALAKATTSASDVLESMDVLRSRAPKAAKGVDMATKALRAYAIAVATAATVQAVLGSDASLPVEQLTTRLTGAADAAKEFDKALQGIGDDNATSLSEVLQKAIDPNWFQSAQYNLNNIFKAATGGIVDLGNPVSVATEHLDELDQVLSNLVTSGNGAEAQRILRQVTAAAEEQGIPVEELNKKLPKYAEATAAAANAQEEAASTSSGLASGLGGVQKAAEDAQGAVSDLADEIRNFGDVNLSADEAQDKFRQSVDDFYQTMQDNKGKAKEDADAVAKGEMTKAEAARNARDRARDQNDALRELATRGKDAAAALLEQTGSEEKAKDKMAEARAEFIKAATQSGLTKDAAKALADQYGLIPANVTTAVAVTGAEAARLSVQNLIDTIARLNGKTVGVGVRYTYSGRLPNGGRGLGGGSTADADGALHTWRSGQFVKAYASGGMWEGSLRHAQPQIARAGGKGILWAEEGAGPWEAFISGHPAKRGRSRRIAEDTVSRLGGRIEWARPFADGGMVGSTTNTHTTNSPIYVQNLNATDVADFQRKARDEERWRRSIKGSM